MTAKTKIRPTRVPTPPPLGAGGAGAGAAGVAAVSVAAGFVPVPVFDSGVGLPSPLLPSDAAGVAIAGGTTTAVTSGSGTAICWVVSPLGRLISTSLVVLLPPVGVTVSRAAPLGRSVNSATPAALASMTREVVLP